MFKSNKGITLISLTIYVIVLVIVIALMSNISGNFYKHSNQITIKETSDEQFLNFLAYLTKDINQESISFIKVGTSENESEDEDVKYIIIRFEENIEHQYLYENDTIYYVNKSKNKIIKLCNNVTSCVFLYEDKTLITNITINNKDYSKTLKINNI